MPLRNITPWEHDIVVYILFSSIQIWDTKLHITVCHLFYNAYTIQNGQLSCTLCLSSFINSSWLYNSSSILYLLPLLPLFAAFYHPNHPGMRQKQQQPALVLIFSRNVIIEILGLLIYNCHSPKWLSILFLREWISLFWIFPDWKKLKGSNHWFPIKTFSSNWLTQFANLTCTTWSELTDGPVSSKQKQQLEKPLEWKSSCSSNSIFYTRPLIYLLIILYGLLIECACSRKCYRVHRWRLRSWSWCRRWVSSSCSRPPWSGRTWSSGRTTWTITLWMATTAAPAPS